LFVELCDAREQPNVAHSVAVHLEQRYWPIYLLKSVLSPHTWHAGLARGLERFWRTKANHPVDWMRKSRKHPDQLTARYRCEILSA
jgi:hypothetical protein